MKQKGGIWVPDRDTGILNDMVQVEGVPAYQLDRLNAALDYLPPKRRRRAVDAGAHVGLWTLHMSRFFQHVDAFEPIPENVACWLRNCGKTANAHLWHCGLGDKSGDTADLVCTDGTSWSWTRNPEAAARGGIPSVAVPLRRLDELKLIGVDLIKIDVEGDEMSVLCGATDTLTRCRPVVLIEEKHDPLRLATKLLVGLGMHEVWKKKHDHLFVWGSV